MAPQYHSIQTKEKPIRLGTYDGLSIQRHGGIISNSLNAYAVFECNVTP